MNAIPHLLPPSHCVPRRVFEFMTSQTRVMLDNIFLCFSAAFDRQ